MPLTKEKLGEEAKMLGEIEKVQEIIRKKHQMIKMGKENMEEAANEYFKPVLDPLNKMVAHMPPIKKIDHEKKIHLVNNKEKEKQINFLSPNSSLISEDLNNTTHGEVSFTSDTPIDTFNNEVEISDDDDDDDRVGNLNKTIFKTQIISEYLKKLNTKEFDRTFGVRQLKSGYYIGNCKINIGDNNEITINGNKYEATPGLMELMFKKNPNHVVIHSEDEKSYKEIVLSTNAHRKQFDPRGELKGLKSGKF